MDPINIVPNGPSCIPVTNKAFTSHLLRTINYAYSIKNESTFPGPQPVSIEKKDLEKFNKYEYNITLKLDGTRFLLYFMTDRHQNKQAILINRALNLFFVSIRCDNSLYDGTLLDGELIEIDSKWVLSIHDGLSLCGNKISKNTHEERINDIRFCTESFIENHNQNTFKIETKKFYKFSDFQPFIKDYHDSINRNNCDGIIFMPNKLPVVSGTQYSMFKWKPSNKHTFDFEIHEKDNDFIIKVYHLNNLIDFANVLGNTDEGKEFIQKTKLLDNYKNECIVECYFNIDKQNFTPFLIRTDKTHPNSLRTIERTLFNIQENIQLDDFLNVISNNTM